MAYNLVSHNKKYIGIVSGIGYQQGLGSNPDFHVSLLNDISLSFKPHATLCIELITSWFSNM